MHARKIVNAARCLRIDFLTNSEICKANKYQLFFCFLVCALSKSAKHTGNVRSKFEFKCIYAQCCIRAQILFISEHNIYSSWHFEFYFPKTRGNILIEFTTWCRPQIKNLMMKQKQPPFVHRGPTYQRFMVENLPRSKPRKCQIVKCRVYVYYYMFSTRRVVLSWLGPFLWENRIRSRFFENLKTWQQRSSVEHRALERTDPFAGPFECNW